MIILLYFFASVFIVLAFLLLFAFWRSRNWGLVLLSLVYSTAGLGAGYSLKWWPLIAGFVVAWLLRFAGYDPGFSLKRRVPADPAADTPTEK